VRTRRSIVSWYSALHPLALERHVLHLGLDARVGHDVRHDRVAVGTRAIDDPGEHDDLIIVRLHGPRERGELAIRQVVPHAFHKGERAVLLPDLTGPRGHFAIRFDVRFRHRHDEPIDIGHEALLWSWRPEDVRTS